MESFTIITRLLFYLTVYFGVSARLDSKDCPVQCSCSFENCHKNSQLCGGRSGPWAEFTCGNFSENVVKSFSDDVDSLKFQTLVNITQLLPSLQYLPRLEVLSVPLIGDAPPLHGLLSGQVEISYLNLSCGVLRVFPEFIPEIVGLKKLNLSNNAIQGRVTFGTQFQDLEVLDLSGNAVSSFAIVEGFPKLRVLYLQSNQLHLLPRIKTTLPLKELDISDNFFLLDDTLNEHNYDDEKTREENCAIHLPSKITSLYLRSNLFWRIPSEKCGPLAGLTHLQHLYLENNSIYGIGDDDFAVDVANTLMSLRLDNNKIRYINANAFNSFSKLKLLTLTNNLLQRIPIQVLNHIEKQLEYRHQSQDEFAIQLSQNQFSCDCTQQEFIKYLQDSNNGSRILSPDDIGCYHPYWLYGSRMSALTPSDLQCFDVVLERTKNVTCNEYDDCALECLFDGLPYPLVHWFSPSGKEISDDTLGQNPALRDAFSLSENGQKLTVINIQYHKTGTYRCVGSDRNSSLSGYVRVGVVLTPVGSVVAIVVSAVSFLVAIVLNSVNLFHYYCQHLTEKRKRREEEAMCFKMESPIKSKRKGLHESEASLNANKYYRKYDFTCQQVFLDTVIKGAHTVKRTLYDAKNSGFSNNVWEYAAHLRDRLHIELPSSVQFPRVSMPSISMPSISMPTISMPSMPNISMPSMPNFQSINTNIEKLGTSVMHRSHNLATSVGSVFTLRWLRSGNSDNESDSECENPAVSRVRVHVHNHNDAMSSQELLSSGENLPGVPGGGPVIIGVLGEEAASSKMLRQRDETNTDETCTPRRTKSVRFTDDRRPSVASNLRRSASFDALTGPAQTVNQCDQILSSAGDTCQSVVVTVTSHVSPETYQYETTV